MGKIAALVVIIDGCFTILWRRSEVMGKQAMSVSDWTWFMTLPSKLLPYLCVQVYMSSCLLVRTTWKNEKRENKKVTGSCSFKSIKTVQQHHRLFHPGTLNVSYLSFPALIIAQMFCAHPMKKQKVLKLRDNINPDHELYVTCSQPYSKQNQ